MALKGGVNMERLVKGYRLSAADELRSEELMENRMTMGGSTAKTFLCQCVVKLNMSFYCRVS